MENNFKRVNGFQEFEEYSRDNKHITNFIQHVSNVSETLAGICKDSNGKKGFMVFACDDSKNDENATVGLVIAGATPEQMSKMLSAAIQQNEGLKMALLMALAKSI